MTRFFTFLRHHGWFQFIFIWFTWKNLVYEVFRMLYWPLRKLFTKKARIYQVRIIILAISVWFFHLSHFQNLNWLNWSFLLFSDNLVPNSTIKGTIWKDFCARHRHPIWGTFILGTEPRMLLQFLHALRPFSWIFVQKFAY